MQNHFRLIVLAGFCAMALPTQFCRAQTTRPITFTHDIAPIVYTNCVSCHRPDQVAPFPLISYSDVKKRAVQIAEVTQSRYMPPWKPEPGYGHFQGEQRLSDEQIKLISDWSQSGAAEGKPGDLPPLPHFTEGWRFGEPDLVVKMPRPFTLAADGDHGRDVYRCFVIPLNLAENKFVTAVDFRPSNRRVVHHALLYLDSTGVARTRQEQNQDGQIGYSTFGSPGFIPTGGLGGWAPGAMPLPLADGWAKLLRKGSDLVIQIHFHPDGKEEVEQSSLGIYFAKTPTTHIVAGTALINRRIDIQPGDSSYVVTAQRTIPFDVDLIGVTPHAHLICKDMQANATLPDGTKIPLIWIKDWDFNWQGQYRYVTPIRLPAGTVVDMKYTYDNSDQNIRNPSTPPKEVRFGEQTTDEMAILFLNFSPVNQADWAKIKLRGIGALLAN